MKKNIKYIIFLAGLVLFNMACVEIDNYEAPNASFGGIVIDKTTGQGISAEQPNGFRIRWRELSWGDNVQPDYFHGMPDGKFNWNFAFGYKDSQYEITPVEGAFVTPDPQVVTINKKEHKELVFEVIPFIHIDSKYELNGRTLTVRFTATRPAGSTVGANPYALSQVWILVSDKTPYVSYLNSGGYNRDISLRINPFTETHLGQEIVNTLTFANPGTYFFRVSVQTSNPSNRCNYTPVVRLDVK